MWSDETGIRLLPATVNRTDVRNHAIPGVNAGYITRHKLLEDHLRSQQQAISGAVFAALGETLVRQTTVRNWLGHRASRRALQIEANTRVTTDRAFGREAA
jgi:hypothetical protein